MSIDGRITVDCLFHDKDGTAALKVLSLESSTPQTTGKVAIASGTVSSSEVTIALDGATSYRNAAGNLVIFEYVRAVGFSYIGSGANGNATLTMREDGSDVLTFSSREGRVAVSQGRAAYSPQIVLSADGSGETGTYTVMLYGD